MYLFMTGYPGFIATRLVRAVAKKRNFDKFYLLVLSTPDKKFVKQAQQEVQKNLSDLPIEIVEGDITQKDLGMSAEHVKAMTEQEGVWWHLAAIYRLDVGEAFAKKVNVEGTRQVIDLAKKCSALKRLNYVSTAYVSGDREGKVLEDELLDKRAQGFKNYYESTKNEAEFVVRAAIPALAITIYRFGVVVGDSKTGETAKFDGPYFLCRFFNRWGKVPLPYVGAMKSRFNMVPVDFVVNASAAISERDDTVGKTYHITDPAPWTAGEIYKAIAKELSCPQPLGKIPPVLLALIARSRFVRRLLDFPKESITYMNHGAQYDCSNTIQALKEEGISCPSVSDYIGTLTSWFKENKDRKELYVPVD